MEKHLLLFVDWVELWLDERLESKDFLLLREARGLFFGEEEVADDAHEEILIDDLLLPR